MQGGGFQLLDPGSGMGKTFRDSANCDSRLSTVYPPTLAGQPEIERHNKLHNQKKNQKNQ